MDADVRARTQQHYRAAVVEGNFMAMRQAALCAGAKSQKMQRLLDIVEEAEDNERRVIVFSHFRECWMRSPPSLPGKVFGPLTGSVPAAKRQTMVDEFSAAGHGAVLVAQIVAGGVGLNIQAASVVVICEPQLKPTTEWQAIARSHRMGQLESVQVHRLLSEEGVDQRITEILARKSELFAEFARVSETADSAPEAFDISDAELAREIVAAERVTPSEPALKTVRVGISVDGFRGHRRRCGALAAELAPICLDVKRSCDKSCDNSRSARVNVRFDGHLRCRTSYRTTRLRRTPGSSKTAGHKPVTCGFRWPGAGSNRRPSDFQSDARTN